MLLSLLYPASLFSENIKYISIKFRTSGLHVSQRAFA